MVARNWGRGRSRAAARRRSLRAAEAAAQVMNLDPYRGGGYFFVNTAPGGAEILHTFSNHSTTFAGYFGARRVCGPGWRAV